VRTSYLLAGAGALVSLSLLWPRDSHAQAAIGLDVSAVHGGTNPAWGFGLDGRVGYRTGFPRAWIVHSVIVQFEGIGGIRQLLASSDDIDIKTLGGGVRIGGALSWFQPFVYGHFNAANALGDWGYLIDVGGALDWRLRTYSLGVHYTHSWLHIPPGWQQFDEFGPHVEVRGFWF
jgi:hypothetical protein